MRKRISTLVTVWYWSGCRPRYRLRRSGCCLLGGLLRLVRGIAGDRRVLIGQIRGVLRFGDASLGARVHVFDVAGICG